MLARKKARAAAATQEAAIGRVEQTDDQTAEALPAHKDPLTTTMTERAVFADVHEHRRR